MSLKKNGKGVIRLGDSISHGGKVVSAKPTDMGKQIACVGDMTVCLQCEGTFPMF